MYTVLFEGKNEQHERFYTNCFMAISLSQRTTPLAEWDDVIQLVKKLKAVGRDVGEKVNSYAVFVLRDEGGIIELERAEHRLLLDFLKQPIWRPLALDEMKATVTWLESCREPSVETKPKLVEQA